jgi:hypothetical protein
MMGFASPSYGLINFSNSGAHSRGAISPGLCNRRRSLLERAQGKPGADRTRSHASEKTKDTCVFTTGTAEQSRLSPRNGLTVYFVLSPVSGLYCHRYPTSTGRQGLTPGSRRQDHTTSPYALAISSHGLHRADANHVHRNPHQRSVTMRSVPFGGRGLGRVMH